MYFIIQVVSEFLGRSLVSLSCHLNTDASDLLGGLRPARDAAAAGADESKDKKLLEWQVRKKQAIISRRDFPHKSRFWQ